MPAFADTLEAFAQAVVAGGALPPGATAPRYAPDAALAAYRNNYRGNLQQALAGTYPVIMQVVGEAFFRPLAARFIDAHPSRSGNLHDYGAALGPFLEDFAPARSLPYLPDLARLEWACHRAWFAPDAASPDWARLATLPPESCDGLVFPLHPAAALLASAHPVGAIWHAHQPGAPADFHIDLDQGPCHLLVHREGLVVAATALDPAEHAWLSRIALGLTLTGATAGTLADHPDFNPSTLLPLLQTPGVLADPHLEIAP